MIGTLCTIIKIMLNIIKQCFPILDIIELYGLLYILCPCRCGTCATFPAGLGVRPRGAAEWRRRGASHSISKTAGALSAPAGQSWHHHVPPLYYDSLTLTSSKNIFRYKSRVLKGSTMEELQKEVLRVSPDNRSGWAAMLIVGDRQL